MGKMYFVYILRCADGIYYTGVTNDVQRRLLEHQGGENSNSFTFSRRPVSLVYLTEFSNIEHAIEMEKKIKKWSKAKKEALINENYDLLPTLSKKVFKKGLL